MDEIRLIDANALKEKLLNSCVYIYGRRSRKTFTKEMIAKVFQIIDKEPSFATDEVLKEKAETYATAYRIMSSAFEGEVRKNKRLQSEWKCPECGEGLFACPNCGADMRPEKKLQTPSCLTNPERQAELLERYREE